MELSRSRDLELVSVGLHDTGSRVALGWEQDAIARLNYRDIAGVHMLDLQREIAHILAGADAGLFGKHEAELVRTVRLRTDNACLCDDARWLRVTPMHRRGGVDIGSLHGKSQDSIIHAHRRRARVRQQAGVGIGNQNNGVIAARDNVIFRQHLQIPARRGKESEPAAADDDVALKAVDAQATGVVAQHRRTAGLEYFRGIPQCIGVAA